MENKIFNFDLSKKWDYENGFNLTSDIKRISKTLAHYELYKSIINIPGDVVEFGVFKGSSLIKFATFREILESPSSRKVIGFDAFGSFPQQENENDKKFIEMFEKESGTGIPLKELEKSLKHKKLRNYNLIEGNIIETLPLYMKKHPELKISLLHIDVDVYEPTKFILNSLFKKVVKGGLIILDDYATVVGETLAVDEFFEGTDYMIEKLPISHIPAFIRKK